MDSSHLVDFLLPVVALWLVKDVTMYCYNITEVCRISATRALTCNSLLWAMLSVMSFEAGTSYSAQSVPYMEGNALSCCKDSANLCSVSPC